MKKQFIILGIILTFISQYSYANLEINDTTWELTPPPSCTMSGTFSIGTGGNFPTITRALDSLKSIGISGNILFELLPNYVSSSEVYPITFPRKSQIPCYASSNYTVTLRPAINAVNLQIMGTLNGALIVLDSCNYVTIDGRSGGLGNNNNLSVINNRAGSFEFQNASNNVVKYVNCKGWVQVFPFVSAFGIIHFFSINSSTCSNNKIESCDISSGNPGYKGDNLIISHFLAEKDSIINCNFHDFTNVPVSLSPESSGWVIKGNSFYNPPGVAFASNATFIKIPNNPNNSGHFVENNYFGGTEPKCLGSQMLLDYPTFIDAVGSVSILNNNFKRINIITGDNEINLIRLGNSTNSQYGTTRINNNIFGGTNISDSIHIFFNYPLSNNKLLLTFINVFYGTGSASTFANEFNNIRCHSDHISKSVSLTFIKSSYRNANNIIGSPTVYNSIINNTNGEIIGIDGGKALNNTISNITNTSSFYNASNGTDGNVRGIISREDSIYYNKIFRLSVNTSHSNIASIIGIWGIDFVIGLTPTNANENIIHSLINNGTGGSIIAIYSSTAINADKNLIHSLVITNPLNTTGNIYGIYNSYSNATSLLNTTITNNTIRLGLDTLGNSMTIPAWIYGIMGGTTVFHNSIAIMGNNVTDFFRYSYCYYSANPNSLVSNVKNNIFYNLRSNASITSIAKHYCLRLQTTDQSNYNLFYVTGTGGTLGSTINSSNTQVSFTNFNQWQTGTGKDLNSVYGDPLFINPGGNYSTLNLHLANGTPAESAGIAANTTIQDIDKEIRSNLSPVDIGADASNFNQCAAAHAGNDTSVCTGQSVQIGTQPLPNHIYSWTSSPTGFSSSLANPIVTPNANTSYFLTLSNASGTCISKDTIIIGINTPVTPSIIISTTSSTICSGTSATFICTTNNAGVNPLYQWQVNGINTGTNSNTFTTSTLNNNDQVKVILTSSLACVSSTTVTSNVITITVNSSVQPSASINTSSTSICSGTTAVFTAAATNGGANPVYQWQINGINAGNNSNTFTTSTLNNNDQIKVILTSSLTCASPTTATSNIISMTVNLMPVANAGNDAAVCAGSSTQLNGSGGATYLWTPAAGLNNANIANPVASPTATTAYILTAFNTANCFSKDTVVISVIQPVTPTVNISTANNNICLGTATTFTATAINGGANPVFQWQVNGINAGTNNNIFTSTTLNNNDQVKLTLTSNANCVTTPVATSNIITLNVQQLATPLVSLNNKVFTVTNPDAAATYTWQTLTNNVWVNVIPIATGITYTSTAAGEYRVMATKGVCISYSASQVTNLSNRLAANNPFGIYLYPNPASNMVTLDSIKLQQQWETLDIIAADGKHVLPTVNIKNQTSVSIDVRALRNGTYFVQLRKKDGAFTTLKFVKQ